MVAVTIITAALAWFICGELTYQEMTRRWGPTPNPGYHPLFVFSGLITTLVVLVIVLTDRKK